MYNKMKRIKKALKDYWELLIEGYKPKY